MTGPDEVTNRQLGFVNAAFSTEWRQMVRGLNEVVYLVVCVPYRNTRAAGNLLRMKQVRDSVLDRP